MARLKTLGFLMWNLGLDIKLHQFQNSAMVFIDVLNNTTRYYCTLGYSILFLLQCEFIGVAELSKIFMFNRIL